MIKYDAYTNDELNEIKQGIDEELSYRNNTVMEKEVESAILQIRKNISRIKKVDYEFTNFGTVVKIVFELKIK